MKRKTVLLICVLLVLVARLVAAQEICADNSKFADCWTDTYKAARGTKEAAPSATKVAEAETAAKTEMDKKMAGPDSFASGLNSTIKNFLPLFDGLVESQTISDDGNTLTLNFNFPFLDLGNGRNFQTQGVFRKPVLFEEVKKAFPEMIRTARTDELEKKLDDLDDASLVLSYNIVTARTGRNFEPHRPLHSAIFLAISDLVPNASQQQIIELGRLIQANPELFDGETFGGIEDPGVRASAKALVQLSARSAAEHTTTLEEMVKMKGLDLFADLVNNQPQVYATAAYRSRQELVGPDELTAKFSWEKGFFNINSMRGKLGADCLAKVNTSGTAVPECLASYSDWVTKNRSRIKAGERIALSAEYSEDDAYSFQRPTDNVNLRLSSSHKLMASFSYGRYLIFGNENQNTRLDVMAQYEDFSKDATKRDRGVGSITLTRKISDSVSLPIGLVYANHGQFLGDVDKKFSAHFGLKFKLSGQGN